MSSTKRSAVTRAPAKKAARKSATSAKPAAKRRTQAERSEQMQSRLVEATANLLRRRGYAGLRTDEVARIAKVSRGALLHHYATKDDLVLATAEYLLRSGLERGTARAVAARGQADVIEAIIQDGLDFFMGRDFPVVLDLVMACGKDTALRDQVYGYSRESRTGVEDVWTQLLSEQGVPKDKAAKIVFLTLGVVRGFAVRALWQKDEALFRTMLDEWKLILSTHLKSLQGDLT
jgi:AcrR family transcriptional regulator